MDELNMNFDLTEFLGRSGILKERLKLAANAALGTIADEILRLSQMEVPFVTGELMSTGVSQENGDLDWVVGYNKVYAAYMHEGMWHDGSHVIQNYSNGRKGKYLEDPIKVNKEILKDYFGHKLNVELMTGA